MRQCTEADLQIKFFSWIRRVAIVDECFSLVYSVPNEGAQSEVRRLRMYRMGLTPGVSDINVDLPSTDGRYGFLRIELKSETGVQKPEQREYQRLVTEHGGGLYVICRSMEDILNVFNNYFRQYNWHLLYAKYGVKDRRPKSLKQLVNGGLKEAGKDFV